MQNVYEVLPTGSQKSFNGKAKAYIDFCHYETCRTLYSYGTPIMTIYEANETRGRKIIRHWSGWTATTGRHIAAFADINKREFFALELREKPKDAPERL